MGRLKVPDTLQADLDAQLLSRLPPMGQRSPSQEISMALRDLNCYVRSPLALLCIAAKDTAPECGRAFEAARVCGSTLSVLLQELRDQLRATEVQP